MKNGFYEKLIKMVNDEKELTLLNFVEVCDKLELPVFAVEITLNPFAEPYRIVTPKMYENMSAFKRTMPDWAARSYDYENDRATYYLSYPGIADGDFEVRASNKSTVYQWHFEVVGECVVVHKQMQFTD